MEKMNVRKRLNHPSIQIFALQISLIIPEYHLPNRYLVLPSYTPLIPNPITYSHLSGYRSIELTNERKVNRMRKKKERKGKREKKWRNRGETEEWIIITRRREISEGREKNAWIIGSAILVEGIPGYLARYTVTTGINLPKGNQVMNTSPTKTVRI